MKRKNQYKPDYQCQNRTKDKDGIEIDKEELNNHLDEQIESEKRNGRKRKTAEKEGLPEKVSPMRKMNKIKEKDSSEKKTTEGEETSKMIASNQMNEALTTIDGIQITKEDRISLENGKSATCTIISLFIKQFESINIDVLEENKILLIQPAIVQLLQ